MDENQCPSNNCLSKLALTVTANFGLALSTRRNFVPAEARICQMAWRNIRRGALENVMTRLITKQKVDDRWGVKRASCVTSLLMNLSASVTRGLGTWPRFVSSTPSFVTPATLWSLVMWTQLAWKPTVTQDFSLGFDGGREKKERESQAKSGTAVIRIPSECGYKQGVDHPSNTSHPVKESWPVAFFLPAEQIRGRVFHAVGFWNSKQNSALVSPHKRRTEIEIYLKRLNFVFMSSQIQRTEERRGETTL